MIWDKVNHFIIKRILSNFSSPDNMRYFNFKDFLTSFFISQQVHNVSYW